LLGRDIELEFCFEVRFGVELFFRGVSGVDFAGARSIIFGFASDFGDRGGLLITLGWRAIERFLVSAGVLTLLVTSDVMVLDRDR
jgi:hypothetical protein